MKNNRLQKGIRKHKFLKESIYYPIAKNNIDIGLIIALAIFILSNVDSESRRNLIIHIYLITIFIYLAKSYLKVWKELIEYYAAKKKLTDFLSNANKTSKIKNIKSADTLEFLTKLNENLKNVIANYSQKKDQYKDMQEYLKYEKVDLIETDLLLNQNKEVTTKSTLYLLGLLSVVLHFREIPHYENANVYKLFGLIGICIISVLTKWFVN
ncbi:hypothetical protein [Draconibacterium orientale]|uniref:hypothetical protein n=1 Tax=Draconibacterium orientale TaxID=1168034 RepID=UPI0029C0C573|nr:hypothetical protein [Draconibacterium orientale]